MAAEFLRAAAARRIPTLLDTYGEALRQGLETPPTIVKANRHEVSGLLGRPVDTMTEQLSALDGMRRSGAQWAILTLGEEGALFSAGASRWLARAPHVQVVNPMGSGDAMTAGVLTGLLRGWPPEECFRYGMAAAVANVQSFFPCRITAQAVEEMGERIAVVPCG